MVRHIVGWSFLDGLAEEQKKEYATRIKTELESLTSIVSGVIEIKVYIDLLDTSNREVVLNSLFADEEALVAYQAHREHKKVGAFIGSVMQDRACLDYHE
jgi:heme-degrading monooxygenase HmoA